jgi:hypothetical protein
MVFMTQRSNMAKRKRSNHSRPTAQLPDAVTIQMMVFLGRDHRNMIACAARAFSQAKLAGDGLRWEITPSGSTAFADLLWPALQRIIPRSSGTETRADNVTVNRRRVKLLEDTWFSRRIPDAVRTKLLAQEAYYTGRQFPGKLFAPHGIMALLIHGTRSFKHGKKYFFGARPTVTYNEYAGMVQELLYVGNCTISLSDLMARINMEYILW